jgi:hypothetical protein
VFLLAIGISGADNAETITVLWSRTMPTLTCTGCRRPIYVTPEEARMILECAACGTRMDPEPLHYYAAQPAQPGKAQAIQIMVLICGGLAIVGGLILLGTGIGICWPGTYFAFAAGGIAIAQACKPTQSPKLSCILMIVNIINGNIATLVLGILCLVFLTDPQVREYYSGG